MDTYPSDRTLGSLAAAAVGAASVFYAGPLFLLASPHHDTLFHWTGSAASLFLPVPVDTLLLAIGIFAVLVAVRSRTWLCKAAWACLLCLPLLASIEYAMYLTEASPPRWLQRVLLLVCLLIALSLISLRPRVFEHIRGIGHLALSCIAFAAAILFAEIVWTGIEARHLNKPPFATEITNAVPATAVPHGRIIWIVLDELALKQAFEEHPAGEDLPAFDALKAGSTLFTNVVPAAGFTELAIPSLITGQKLVEAHPTADGQLQLKTAGLNWIDFDARSTVFTDAQSLGYHTAIAGWYLPYCRILGGAFSYCTWFFHTQPVSVPALKEIAVSMRNRILHPETGGALPLHLTDFLSLKAATDRILQAKQFDFVYLHLPVPHPNGIYDRKTGAYALNRSVYVDNLALADAYMKHVRQVLETQGEWDDDTILIMGDHSWRTQGERVRPPWSPEDVQANHDGFDPRPAYLLKLPHQQTAATVDSEFQALRTRSLLNALLRDELHSPADVQNWAATVAGRE